MKKKISSRVKIDPQLQKAIDSFPRVVKAKEKASKERQRIMKNFKSVEKKIFPK